MQRQKIHKILKNHYTTYSIGQNAKDYTKPYIVVRGGPQRPSAISRKGGWRTFDILCYVPDTSSSMLDDMVQGMMRLLTNEGYETSKQSSEDYHDEAIKMYMRYFTIEIPKEVI